MLLGVYGVHTLRNTAFCTKIPQEPPATPAVSTQLYEAVSRTGWTALKLFKEVEITIYWGVSDSGGENAYI